MIEDPNKNRKKAAKKLCAMNEMNSWEMLRKSIKSQNSFIWDFLQRSLFDCISILSKRFHSNRLFSTKFKAHLGEYFRFYIKIIGSIQNWIVWNVRERMRLIIYSTKLRLAHSLFITKSISGVSNCLIAVTCFSNTRQNVTEFIFFQRFILHIDFGATEDGLWWLC